MEKITTILHRHIMLSTQMLMNFIKLCPEGHWDNKTKTNSMWKRLLHVLESIDFWLDDFSDYRFPELFKGFSAEMDENNKNQLSKKDIREYFQIINMKIEMFFNMLPDNKLTDKSKKHPKVTYLDIILSQIRHIQTNVGYCNKQLNFIGLKGVEWTGYNE